MTYLSGVSLKDSVNLDAFARLRVSDPLGLHDSKLTYDLNPLIWESVLTGSGTVTHLPNESAARMRVTTASGDKVVRQSRYIQYRPGKSQMILITGVFGAKKTNVRTRVGLFDANNGLFFENDGTNLKFVVRSYTSGSVSDANYANQSSWNIDKLDGTGPSGYTLDPSKGNILFIDAEWLGVGRVRFGFVINGIPVYAHAFNHANSVSTVYATTISLPVRYEIENTGTTASQTDMLQICSAVQAEGGDTATNGQIVSAGTGTTTVGVTTRRPLLTIRPKATFNSVTNRSLITPVGYDFYCTTNDSYVEIIRGGTLSGSPSYTSAGSNSAVEYDVAASGISGGDVLLAFWGTTGAKGGSKASLNFSEMGLVPLPLSLDAAGSNPTTLSVVANSMTGTSNAGASLTWTEVR